MPNFDKHAKAIRTKIHIIFYGIGLLTQQHSWKLILFSLAVYGTIAVTGMQHITFDNDYKNLWTTTSGRVQKELDYTKKLVGDDKYGEAGSDAEYIIQISRDGKENILTKENLMEHLQLMKEIVNMKVTLFDREWGLADLCQSYIPLVREISSVESEMVEKLTPCLISTPLDCFWEGSYLFPRDKNTDLFSWLKDRPIDVLQKDKDYFSPFLVEFLRKIGAEDGYKSKPCLDEADPDCPTFIANRKKPLPKLDIGGIITGGCFGPAKKYMYWPEESIIGEPKKNSSGYIKSATALQTIIHISNAQVLYEASNGRMGLTHKWTVEKAEQVLREWKLALTDRVSKESKTTHSKILAFTTESFNELIKKIFATDFKKIWIGTAIICCYSIFTLKRFTTSVFSYGLLGFFAPLLLCGSTISGIGLTHFLGIRSSTPITTEVLPLVSLSLSLDNMFLLLRTYVYVCDAGNVSHQHIVPTCLGECGLSLTIASLIHICCFLVGSTIPIVVLQRFCQQAAVVMFMNWLILILTVTPILCYDVDRQVSKRDDWCCIKIDDLDADDRMQANNTNIDDNFRCSFPHQRPSSSVTVNSNSTHFSLNRSRLQYNVTPQSFVETIRTDNVEMGRCGMIFQKASLNYFVQKYVTGWMTLKKVKVTILAASVVLLCISLYGSAIVTQGLDLAEIIPKPSSQRDFFIVQRKYFSYHNLQIITKELDYAKKQAILREFYDRISQVDHVIKVSSHEDYKLPQLWLDLFKKWLEDADTVYKKEQQEGWIPRQCSGKSHNATIISRQIFHLKCEQSCPEDLVRNGIINTCLFYRLLNLWYSSDYLGASQVLIKPDPYGQVQIKFVTNSFKVHGLKTTKQNLNFIKNIREVCDEFKAKGIDSYPLGMAFLYWEQFVVLNDSLIRAGCIALLIAFVTVLICFMSIRAALLVLLFTVVGSLELYGFIGLLNLNFNAVSAVVLLMSVGMGVEYSIHTVMAFVNTPGDRNTRMKAAIEVTFVSSVDGILTTLIMLVLLSYSQYEFVTKYFFNLLICLIAIITFNSLLVIPVTLSFFGPCCEVTKRAIVPAIPPVFVINVTPEHNRYITKKQKRRRIRKSPDLTTISECSERLSSAGSNTSGRSRCRTREDGRLGTPTVRYNNNKSDVFIEDYDVDNEENYQERQCCHQRGRETRCSNRSETSIGSGCSNDTNSSLYVCSHCHKEQQNFSNSTSNSCNSRSIRQSPYRKTARQKCNHNSNTGVYEATGQPTQPHVIEVDENRHTMKVKASFEIEIPHTVGIGPSSRYNQNEHHFTPVD